MNDDKRVDLAQWAVEQAVKNGADQAAVTISNERDIEVEVRDRKIEKLKDSTTNSLALRIYVENRYSSHSTSNLRKDALVKLIGQAVASTKYLAKDQYRSLPDPRYYPKKMDIDLKLSDETYEKVDSSERKKIASQIEEVVLAQSDKIISTTTGYSDGHYHKVKVHSNGFVGQSEGTYFYSGAMVTVNDPAGGRPMDWYWAGGRFRDEIVSSEFIGKEAVRRALRKIGAKKIESGRYDMIVENRLGKKLFSMLYSPMRARYLQQKRSFLEGMIDQWITSDKLTLIDDPLIEKGLSSQLFDDEGLAGKKRAMIEKGVLKHYYVDDYYGKKLGMEPTSGSISNVVFEYGQRSLEQMIRDMKKGIFVTGFLGGNSNSTTGDFSFGVVGQLVENGKIVQPIKEMNISGNAKQFWAQLAEMGNDPYRYSSWQTPSMLFTYVSVFSLQSLTVLD